jgi:hypothetical protein
MSFYCFGQSQIIGVPIKLSNIEVAQFDFPSSMTRSKAIIACRELGDGWELPTRNQLDSLYKNKNLIGGFKNDVYWTYSLNDEYFMGWNQNFRNGDLGYSDIEVLGYVRAVRVFNLKLTTPTPTPEPIDEDIIDVSYFKQVTSGQTVNVSESDDEFREVKWSKGIPFATTINTASDKRYYSDLELKELNKPVNIIGKPIQIGNLLVAQNEFPIKSGWNSAKLACIGLGNGWRLPTKDELYILYQNKNVLRNFSKYGYWSSTEGSVAEVAYYQDFTNGLTKPSISNKLSTWGVRAVKSL